MTDAMRPVTETVRVTLDLPADLMEAVDATIRDGGAASREDRVVAAIERELNARRRRAEIDAAIAEMANDEALQREAQQLDAEYVQSGWEALLLYMREIGA